MANRFFNNIINLLPFTKARPGDIEQDFSGVSAGFDQVQVELDAAIRAPDGETVGRMPAAVDRANKSLTFDSAGNPIASVAATSSEMAAAVVAASSASASAAAAAASAGTLAGSVNHIQRLQLEYGII